MHCRFSILLSLSLLVLPAIALSTADAGPTVTVTEVLQLGPLTLPLPAFADSEKKGVSLDDLLGEPALDVATLRPHAGDRVPLAREHDAPWQARSASDGSFVIETPPTTPAEVWLAFTVASDRWQKASLQIATSEGVKLTGWLDGAPADLALVNGDLGQPLFKGDVTLPMGRHLVVLRSAFQANGDTPWRLAPSLVLSADLPASAITCAAEGKRAADIHLVLDAPRTRSAALSPDGKLVAVACEAGRPDGKRERWIEILHTDSGKPAATWRGNIEASHLQWLPDGRRLSYTADADGKTDLWIHDLATARTTRVLRGVEHLGRYDWAPDGSFVVYEIEVEAKPDERRVKHVENPADRQTSWRNRSYLNLKTVPDGVTRRLTAGPLSPSTWTISPDGRKLLFFLSDQDLSSRPYFSSTLYELDLVTFAAETILDDPWIEGAAYDPDGSARLLLRGSPSAFDGLGLTLPAGVQPNDYGGQLFLYDRKTGTPTAISRDLTPDVGGFWWSHADHMIYAVCTDQQYQRVYRRASDRDGWERMDTGIEFVDDFDLARDARMAVARGSSAATPDRLYAIDLKRGKTTLLADPGRNAWQDVAFGKVETWAAPMPDGTTLDGRIYYPPDFDAQRTYPVIVYYYGGTSPVTVDFGGRYPKNVWAGQGYVVYVPEPSGATGYGQEFAARHVNDWGKRTAREVIDATQAFLAAHPFADAGHVGCIGASYGGFLTEYLVTQTDIFACAVSHAGISDITSYWGHGWWGYDYGARALANAFPWSDRDIYVEQSPLYHADKIHTPLLLLHGSADTNVPPGESDQLFTALELLGRDVEYVQIEGQNHWILDHDQRIVWNDTILAYFARYLKERPAWWGAMYPE